MTPEDGAAAAGSGETTDEQQQHTDTPEEAAAAGAEGEPSPSADQQGATGDSKGDTPSQAAEEAAAAAAAAEPEQAGDAQHTAGQPSAPEDPPPQQEQDRAAEEKEKEKGDEEEQQREEEEEEGRRAGDAEEDACAEGEDPLSSAAAAPAPVEAAAETADAVGSRHADPNAAGDACPSGQDDPAVPSPEAGGADDDDADADAEEAPDAPAATSHSSYTDKMPSPTVSYTDSSLFLPVERGVMRFVIDGARMRDGVWLYHVVLHTALPFYTQMAVQEGLERDGGRKAVEIQREYRYSKFDWLKHALVVEYPAVIIPPTPPKDASSAAEKLFTFVSDAVEEDMPLLVLERQRELEYFLNYLASHPALREGAILQSFLACKTDAVFAQLKEKTAAMHAEAAKHRLKPEDARRNAAFQTKNAFSWLKSKVSGAAPKEKEAAEKEEDLVTAPLVRYIGELQPWVNEMRAKMEGYYLQCQSRSQDNKPNHGAVQLDWNSRAFTEQDLVVGSLMCTRNGPAGTIMWVGKLPQSSMPHEPVAGVQWVSKLGGTCDGVAHGERHFQGTNGPKGCSFVPMSQMYHPLPRDSVIDALDLSCEAISSALCDFSAEQEKRLFHILSDLQIIRGWMESSKKCVAHFNTTALTEASLRSSLAALRAGKREDVSHEVGLEDRLNKYTKQSHLEKKTFEAEKKRLKVAIACLWRGVLANFATFNADLEVHQGYDLRIAEASNAIESVWE